MKAIEFYSGIGAFAEAAPDFDIHVIAAFDQNAAANSVYEFNFALAPSNRNLESIKIDQIPSADLWWMSPPCTPFSVRGKQRDLDDPRAASFKRLIDFAVVLRPPAILIENVLGFKDSQARKYIGNVLQPLGYCLRTYDLCSTQFGVPMRRPRHYVIATNNNSGGIEMGTTPDQLDMPMIDQDVADLSSSLTVIGSDIGSAATEITKDSGLGAVSPNMVQPDRQPHSLNAFLFERDPDLVLSPHLLERYGAGFDIVDSNQHMAELICFTKNYARCMRASGSLIASDYGIRRVSPEEILGLLGFSPKFSFPATIDREMRWRLVGNSVDVRAIKFLLERSCGRS